MPKAPSTKAKVPVDAAHGTEFAPVIAAFAGDRKVTSVRKFASTNLTAGDKVFAFTNKMGMVVKLPAPRISALIAAGQAVRLVMGKREMKEWAIILPGKASWPQIAREALKFVDNSE